MPDPIGRLHERWDMADAPKLVSAAELARPLKDLIKGPPSKAEHAALIAERKETRPGLQGGRPKRQPTRDLLMQRAYKDTEQLQPVVMARMLRALENENDPLHERAFDIAAKRTLPIAFFESLAKEEFRPDEEQNKTPHIVINVTGGAGTPVKVQTAHDEPVDVEAREVEE